MSTATIPDLGNPVDAAEADRRQLAKEYWADNTWKEIGVCTLSPQESYKDYFLTYDSRQNNDWDYWDYQRTSVKLT